MSNNSKYCLEWKGNFAAYFLKTETEIFENQALSRIFGPNRCKPPGK
jgi:hypothetical protein